MPVFIELTTDAFRDQFAKTVAGKKNAARERSPYGRAGAISVRRPLRGLELKSDTYGMLRVILVDGTEVPLLDSSSPTGKSTGYTNFILQTVQEARMEKHQIVETFGEPYIFFFGESPRFLDVQALLVNSLDFNWEAEWWENYELYLRGTRSVEMGARTYLFYDDNVVEGYILQAQGIKTADQPLSIMLTFRLFLTGYQNISLIGEPAFPIRPGAVIPDGIDLTQDLNGEQVGLLAQEGGLAGGVYNGSFVPELPIQRDFPIRSNIADNWDEWTNAPPQVPTDPYGLDGTLADLENLTQGLLALMQDYGAEEGGPGVMRLLGVGPNFRASAGIGVGFGVHASARAHATFGASARASAFVGGSAHAGAYAGASAYSSAFARPYTNTTPGTFVGAPGAGGVGASTYVSGKPSAFAMVSVKGKLNASGTGSAYASTSSPWE